MKKKTRTKQEALAAIIKFIKENTRYPSMSELLHMGVTRQGVDYNFGNISNLKREAYEACSDIIFDLQQREYKTLHKKNTKRFVITTAVMGERVDKTFYKNIKTYCKDFQAELIVIPALGQDNKTGPKTGWILDPLLKDEVIVTSDLSLNSNIFILGIKANAKTVDPISGLPRIGQRNGTFISASPKQRLKYVPTSLDRLPHALMSTGAITLPGYASNGLMVDKSNYIAHHDHIMGAIILELDTHNQFHFRQIQADKAGTFIDLGTMYKNGKRAAVKPEALILGDWHTGDTDPLVVKGLTALTKKLKVKRWILHDLFDGLSINPHITGKNIVLAKMAENNKLSLGNELLMLKRDVTAMSKLVDEVVVVRSNHDEFLNQYLNGGRYVEDHQNHRIALGLALHLLDGKNPLEESVGKLKNVKWLKLDESYKIAGIELGAHGHMGANGAKGAITSMENDYGNVVFGHTHSAQILRGAWNVGTSTHLRLAYNKGSSSWTQTSCLVYGNGMRQLINFFNGEYTTRAA